MSRPQSSNLISWERRLTGDNREPHEYHQSYVKGLELQKSISQWQVRGILDYWLSIHPKDRLPSRKDFDPIAIPKLLPYVVMTDVEHDPFRLKFRLLGTVISNAFTKNLTGAYFDEAFENFQESEGYQQRKIVAETKEPIHFLGRGKLRYNLDFTSIEWVLLPFADDGENVNIILSTISYGGQ